MSNGMGASNTLMRLVRGHGEGTLNAAQKETIAQARLSKRELDLLYSVRDQIKDTGAFSNYDVIDVTKLYGIKADALGKGLAGDMARQRLFLKLAGFMDSRASQGTPTPTLRQVRKKGPRYMTDSDAFWDMFMTFKKTLIEMTANYVEQFARMYRTQGMGRTIGGGALFTGSSFIFAAGTDMVASAILDREPALNKMAKGDFVGGYGRILGQMSFAPIWTDAIIRTVENKDRWGQSGVTDVIMGPVGSMVRDFGNAFKSRSPEEKLYHWFHDHLLPRPWWVKGPLRHMGLDLRRRGAPKRGTEFDVGDIF